MLKVKAPRKTSFKSPGQSFAATKAKQNCTRATLCSTKLQATGATGTENKHLELYIQTIIQSFDVYGGAKLCPCLYMACNRFADICCHCGLQIGAANLCPCGSQLCAAPVACNCVLQSVAPVQFCFATCSP